MKIHVDVIIPVHNAAETIEETVMSVMQQSIPDYLVHISSHDSNIPSTCTSSDNHCLATNLDAHVNDSYSRFSLKEVEIDLAICCQNDGSEDDSLDILQKIQQSHLTFAPRKKQRKTVDGQSKISCKLLIASNDDNIARGAGAARNGAASLRDKQFPIANDPNFDASLHFLCLLDSDDVMHPHRIAHQVSVMLALSKQERNSALLGCTFDRIPVDSTWHYTQWANFLTDERLMLERFRELTILQPTWMMTKARFDLLGGYIEAPRNGQLVAKSQNEETDGPGDHVYTLIHPQYDTSQTMRLAEDLRFFHAHLSYPYQNSHKIKDNLTNSGKSNVIAGSLQLIRTTEPLLSYRHRAGQSQSSSTPRKLLLQLRAKAFTDLVLTKEWRIESSWASTNHNGVGFIIWGAGRDGKDFFKSLPEDVKGSVKCFVDVDEKKIVSGYYVAPKENQRDRGEESSKRKRKECFKIPIVHWSLVAREEGKRKEEIDKWINGVDNDDELTGRITKQKQEEQGAMDKRKPPETHTINNDQCPKQQLSKRQKIKPSRERKLHAISKKDKINLKLIETGALATLPVVVCVAMYRTNGALERNVQNIGRTEGIDLWHFS